MKKTIFTGAATALITPFTSDGVDYGALRRLVAEQINGGIDALVVCGTTGEAPTLSDTEKLKCISEAADEAAGRVPVIAGTASNDTAHSAILSRTACREGADAVLAVAPYYSKPSAEGLYRHFITVAESAGKPVILYNIPSRTGTDIPLELYTRLSSHELICGVKEASGNLSLDAAVLARCGENLALYSGNDDLTLPVMAVGGKGAISVASNALPSEMHRLCSLCLEGRYADALTLYRTLLPFFKGLFTETNPIPIKAVMSYLGYCSPDIRLPLTEAKESTVSKLAEILKAIPHN